MAYAEDGVLDFAERGFVTCKSGGLFLLLHFLPDLGIAFSTRDSSWR